ncbi:MAG: hypothetical protein ACOC0N_00015 [Chroococcales cyanobacterium]
MAKTIVNLTNSMVTEEIEKILANYADIECCEQVLPVSELRKKLMTFVLSKVPNQYAVCEDIPEDSTTSSSQCGYLAQRSHIYSLLEEGLTRILQSYQELASCSLAMSENSDYSPSHWFG